MIRVLVFRYLCWGPSLKGHYHMNLGNGSHEERCANASMCSTSRDTERFRRGGRVKMIGPMSKPYVGIMEKKVEATI